MVNKKKSHGGLKVLLLLLFIMLLGIFSTCYASTNVTKEYIDWSIQYIIQNANLRNSSADYNTTYKNKLNAINRQILVNEIYENISSYSSINNIEGLRNVNVCFVPRFASSYFKIYVYFSNMTAPGSVPDIGFLYIAPATSSTDDAVIGAQNGYIYRLIIDFNFRNNTRSYSFAKITNKFSESPVGSSFYNSDGDILSIQNIAFAGIPIGYSNYPLSSSNIKTCIFNSKGGNYIESTPEPEEPSGDVSSNNTGTITDNNGDTTGKIDLSGIEQGIGNIQNQISGDTQKVIDNQNKNTQTIVNALSGETEKLTNTLTDSADDLIDNTVISSGDIESALNFEIAQDPYSNFWFTLTNNLKSALLGTKRSIDISFQGRTWTISLDEYMVLPAWLVIILTPFSTAFFTWVLVRQFKLIFDKLSSGNVDALLKENSEERYF